jgi:hypothetical protein
MIYVRAKEVLIRKREMANTLRKQFVEVDTKALGWKTSILFANASDISETS